MDKLRRFGDDRDLGYDRDLDFSAPVSPTGTPGKSTLSGKLMRRAVPGRDDNGVAAGADADVERAASSSGAPLPGDLREKLGASLGADVSSVRVHTGAESAAAASAVGAKAYAVGQDIHFGEGQYNPSSQDGLFLIAHEVAHTVQQAGSTPTPQHKLEVSTPGDAAEVEADRFADAFVAGRAAPVTPAGPAIARQYKKEDQKEKEKKRWWEDFELTVKSPALTGFNDGPELKIGATANGVKITGKVAEGGEKKATNSWEFPMGPAGGAKILGSIGMKVEVGAVVSGTGSFVTHEDDPDKDYADLEVFVGGLFEYAGEGKLGAGPFVGVKDVANASLLATGKLEAKAEVVIGGGGTLRVARDGVSGEIKIGQFAVNANIDVTGSIMGVVEFIGKDIELFDLAFAKWPIGDFSVKGAPTLNLPGGNLTSPVEFEPPEWKVFQEPKATKLDRRLGEVVANMVRMTSNTIAQAEHEQEQANIGDDGFQTVDGTCEIAGGPSSSEPPASENAETRHSSDDETGGVCE
jgi:hypothetical protein